MVDGAARKAMHGRGGGGEALSKGKAGAKGQPPRGYDGPPNHLQPPASCVCKN